MFFFLSYHIFWNMYGFVAYIFVLPSIILISDIKCQTSRKGENLLRPKWEIINRKL
jgi:hypothetical protein